MQKHSKVLLLVVLVAVAGAIWGRQIVGWLTPTKNLMRYPEGPRYYCENCGKHFDEAPGRLPPLKCPQCGKAAAMRTAFHPHRAEYRRERKKQTHICNSIDLTTSFKLERIES